MSINIGDKVRFLREIGGGIVTGFRKGGLILVEDKDGFEIPMLESDLVVIPDNNTASTANDSSKHKATSHVYNPGQHQQKSHAPYTDEKESLEQRICKLERIVQKLSNRIDELEAANALRAHARTPENTGNTKVHTKKPAKNDIIEVNLHANALLDSTLGLSSSEIKDYQMKIFRETMEQYRQDHGRRIVFIHGNGDGVLRKSILTELKYSYKNCRHQDASFQQYGFGATMVTIC